MSLKYFQYHLEVEANKDSELDLPPILQYLEVHELPWTQVAKHHHTTVKTCTPPILEGWTTESFAENTKAPFERWLLTNPNPKVCPTVCEYVWCVQLEVCVCMYWFCTCVGCTGSV